MGGVRSTGDAGAALAAGAVGSGLKRRDEVLAMREKRVGGEVEGEMDSIGEPSRGRNTTGAGDEGWLCARSCTVGVVD